MILQAALSTAATGSGPVLPRLLDPLATQGWQQLLVLLIGYLLTIGMSGYIVRFIILPKGAPPPSQDASVGRFDSSAVIGKCENLITLTLILAGQTTGLAVIFAAKSLVRSDAIKTNPSFYLGGTLVNLVWAMMMAFAMQVLLRGF